jgi:D-inositol-3-phosphate glycosyltransferase
MRILIAGTAYPLRGGIAHYNALLARALSARHTVETITFKRQYPSLLFPGSSQEETADTPPAPPAPQMIDSVNPANWVAVGREVRRRRPDLLLMKYWLPFFGPCFGTIARTAKRGTGLKVVYICDNVVPHERRPGDVVFTRYAFAPADGFIVQSDAVERDLLRMVPQARYRKVPHPVYTLFGDAIPRDRARAALGIAEERVLLFFGYIRAYKGLQVLLDAVAALREPVRLLVVGEFYDDEKKYREQIARLGLEGRVTVESAYVPNDRVGLYFSAADAVVLPYLSATQSGIAQIAYHFSLPVIATNVGGLAEVVRDGETGFVVAPGDPAALAAAIGRFYAEGKREAFALRVGEERKRYSWDAMVKGIEELAG